MSIIAIATLIRNRRVVGMRLIDTESYQTKDVSIKDIMDTLRAGKVQIDNVALQNNGLAGTNGNLNRLPQLTNGLSLKLNSVTIIGKVEGVGYLVCNFEGDVKFFKTQELIEYAKTGMISNGKVVTNGGMQYISAIKGQYNVVKIDKKSIKIQALERFNRVQNAIGKIFDFEINYTNGDIFITKYYDTPDREVVEIPDFVVGFKPSRSLTFAKTYVFDGCKHLKKIIMGSNVRGSMKNLFRGFEGKYLDLSEFDTSNITNMCNMFFQCSFNELNLGGKFNTSKVTDMRGMFQLAVVCDLRLDSFDTGCVTDMSLMFRSGDMSNIVFGRGFNTSKVTSMRAMFSLCRVNKLDLGTSFDTSNVKSMNHMFSLCSAKSINLGDKFYTHNVNDMDGMFNECGASSINLGNNFDTSNVTSMNYMFYGCKARSINLGNNFDTSNVKSMNYMFYDCKARSITLGDKFDTSRVKNMQNMSMSDETEVIELGNKFNTKSVISMESMFCQCKVKKIILGNLFSMVNAKKVGDMFNGVKAELVDFGDTASINPASDYGDIFNECRIKRIKSGDIITNDPTEFVTKLIYRYYESVKQKGH